VCAASARRPWPVSRRGARRRARCRRGGRAARCERCRPGERATPSARVRRPAASCRQFAGNPGRRGTIWHTGLDGCTTTAAAEAVGASRHPRSSVELPSSRDPPPDAPTRRDTAMTSPTCVSESTPSMAPVPASHPAATRSGAGGGRTGRGEMRPPRDGATMDQASAQPAPRSPRQSRPLQATRANGWASGAEIGPAGARPRL
jgi:hypothetical protein